MPLVFIALVVAMLIASYIDNKKQEKRIKDNEESRRRAREEKLRRSADVRSYTCSRDELRIVQVLIRKGISIDDAIKAARAEVDNPCLPEEVFYSFDYSKSIPDDYLTYYDGIERKKDVETHKAMQEYYIKLEKYRNSLIGKTVIVDEGKLGKIVEVQPVEREKELSWLDRAYYDHGVGENTIVRYPVATAALCKVQMFADGKIRELYDCELVEAGHTGLLSEHIPMRPSWKGEY